jgi:hypothetical protein
LRRHMPLPNLCDFLRTIEVHFAEMLIILDG